MVSIINPTRPKVHRMWFNDNGNEAIDLVVDCHKAQQNVLIVSQTSGGKTSVMKHIAKNVLKATDWKKQPLLDASGNPVPMTYEQMACLPGTQAESLVGQWIPQSDGSLAWSDGPMTRAVINGSFIVFEEFSRLNQDLHGRFFSILDEGFRTYPLPEKGESLSIHPNCQVVATANPVQLGYLTHELDIALEDRFVIRDFGNENFIDEPKVIEDICGGDKIFAERMINFATEMRVNAATYVTARQMIQATKLISIADMNPVYAIMRCIGEKFSDHKGVIETAAIAHFTETK